ncbi:hypothetical protein B0H10DRAFT_1959433 [Mycena sp. CBHHK59/15]|nr:hypothetical protein B0H10DRAFT_1959433 [Mycena sp. CBHHK59/15]
MAPLPSGSLQTCRTTTCNLALSVSPGSGALGSNAGAGPEPLGPSLAANAASEVALLCTTAVHQRLRLPPAGSTSQNTAPGTQLTTSTLLAHEHGGGLPGESKIMICWQVRLSKNSKIDATLGSLSKKWATSLYMTDIKSDLLKTINIEWMKNNVVPLEDEDLSFLWAGDHLLKRDTSTMTLGEFYTYYSSPTNAPIYLQNYIPTIWKHVLQQAKIHLLSAWKWCSEIQKQSEITFKKITCITTVATGQYMLMDSGDILRGHIFDKPFASGTMKHAYDLHLSNGDQLTDSNKDIVDLDADSEPQVSVEDNRVQIEGEISRLAIGKWFLEAFYCFCKGHKEISVDQNITFTDAFLAIEVDRPSMASGVAIITEEAEGMTWLVERKRLTTVIKFNGTLVHSSHRKDLRSATISALAHFVFGYSKGSLVFAELQGTLCQVRGKDGLVLFDLMTHTKQEDSGVGDFRTKTEEGRNEEEYNGEDDDPDMYGEDQLVVHG